MLRWPVKWAGALALAAVLGTTVGPRLAEARATLIRQARVTCRDVALTYDTEFSSHTPRLIDTLDELGIRTTWFFLGNQVWRYPDLVRRVAARHEIGNHTYTHPEMSKLTTAQMRVEISQAAEAIDAVGRTSSRPLFRPPYGDWNNSLLDVAEAAGYPMVFLWSVDTRDWTGASAETIREHIDSHVFPGAIVLQHGSAPHTPEATRLAVTDLRALGYQFVTLTELMGMDRIWRDFGGDTYTVQPGDTWSFVGGCHNVTGPRLQAYNGGGELQAGARLAIPHTNELTIRVDGERLTFPVYPRIDMAAGRAVAHVRLAEQLGAQVEWDEHKVHIHKGDLAIVITPGERMARVGDAEADMGTPAAWDGERILVPVRFVAEHLGAAVAWDGETWTASITRPVPAAPTTAPAAPPTEAPPAPPEGGAPGSP
jgi:peptidoglycan-N-acetylglucosamine deacetylase